MFDAKVFSTLSESGRILPVFPNEVAVMKKLMKMVVTLIVLLVVGAVLVLGYLGFVPGLSSVFGSDKPRDLGVTYTAQDKASFDQKIGGTFQTMTEPASDGKTLVFTDKKTAVNKSFTQEELTARLAAAEWKYMPLSSPQLRIKDDGSP